MPLINVNNTTDPKNSIAPNAPFQNVPVNIPQSTVVVDQNQVKQYSAPFPTPEVKPVEEDIKTKFEEKLNNLPTMDTTEELPPLVSPEELNTIKSNLVVENPLPEVSPLNSTVELNNTPVEQTQQVKDLMDNVNMPVEQPVANSTQVVNPNETIDALNSSVIELDEILTIAIKRLASDVHLTPGYRSVIRVDGNLEVASSGLLTPEIVDKYVAQLLKERPEIKMEDIKEFDMTYASLGRRFRVNIFRQMGNFSITLRVIPERILSIGELGLPDIISEFPSFPNGLVLVTGATGSGKSTSIAAILNQINLTMPKHIVTLEDPIEFVFPKGVGLIDQRESGIDFTSWSNALRSVLRQDPDVVLVGEMRDLETVEAALQIAETGHLVFATLHTNGASESINRVIDIFESNKQDQIRVQLSSVLRAVISQKLIPVSTGGRKAAVEILLSTPSVKNAIRDKKTFQIDNIIQTSSDTGMITMEKSLVKMVREGMISKETAKSLSGNPNEIDLLLQ